MKNKIKFVFVVLFSFFLVLSGCSSGNNDQSADGNSKDEKIVLGFCPWPGYYPWYIAQEKGFFKKYGLNVQIKSFAELSDELNAMSSGKIDVAGVTINDMIVPLSKGVDLRAVGVYDISNGGDAFVVKEGIESLKELKGKKVATELGTTDHMLMQIGLEKAGLKLSDVQFTNMSQSAAGNAVMSGKIDGAALYQPFISQAQQKGAKILFSSADVPGLIADVIAVKGDLIDSNPERVTNLLRAWYDSLDYWNDHPDESEKIMAEAANVSIDELETLYDGIKMLTLEESLDSFKKTEDYSSLFYTGQETTKFFKSQEMISSDPDLNKALDGQFLQELKEKGEY